jgi:hypothetical protein
MSDTTEERAAINLLGKAIQKLARDIHEINIALAVLVNILEIKWVCSREAFFAARAAASPIADQIIEEENEKKRREDQ